MNKHVDDNTILFCGVTLDSPKEPPGADAHCQGGRKEEPWFHGLNVEGFGFTDAGVHEYIVSESGRRLGEKRICGPLKVVANARQADGTDCGFQLNWQDDRGVLHEDIFSRSILFDRANRLVATLADSGLFIRLRAQSKVLQYVSNSLENKTLLEMRKAVQTGWVEETLQFVLPKETISQSNLTGTQIFFKPDGGPNASRPIHREGTLEQWQSEIASRCTRPYLIFAVGLSLAAPLIKPAKTLTSTFHFFGKSSRGKTTLLQVAASVWGDGSDPRISTSYLNTWSSTNNGFEAMAANRNDLPFILDELSAHTGKTDNLGYLNALGQGKVALAQDRSQKQARTWLNQGMSSGELSMQQHIEEGKRSLKLTRTAARGGEIVRNFDIPNEGIVGSVEEVDALKDACTKYFGTAGPDFVQKVINECNSFEDLQKKVESRLLRVVEQLCAERTLGIEQGRVAKHFALAAVAAEWAQELSILPKILKVLDSTKLVFDAWLAGAGHIGDDERAIRTIRSFMETDRARFNEIKLNPDGSWEVKDPDRVISKDAGYRCTEYFYFNESAFKEACSGFNHSDTCSLLKKKGFLSLNARTDKYTKRMRSLKALNGRRPGHYWVSVGLLDIDEADDE